MLLLVDEMISLHEEDESIKKISLKGKYNQLQDALRFFKPGLASKKLSIKAPTLDEELEYFSKLFNEYDKIIYFYDARFGSNEMLDRLQNWLLPNNMLWPIPIHGSKAEYLFLKSEVLSEIHKGASYNDMMNHIQNVRKKISSWVISPSPAKVIRADKYNAIYKENKKNIFLLMEMLPNRRIKTHQSGNLEGVWKYISEKEDVNQIWAVTKGIDTELPNVKKHIQIDSMSLPVGIPFIQAITMK
ncbi:hypothetical protein ACFFF5_10710 [Lederbergia wuyishanensis]|uniref:Uncharacterized protein n=1 Tax=Lederbergia wuyishanensis TaxID=1347903 RepID=A0ABU0D6R8_9BACI|nr:hypothetical protein [Lederbergia wuyishanensis]MCJ8008774.1 hypothetical protein [Lederbergia wuyishanensis]MDQ0344094.1 hypothetical protein [Lederbergia wuyishanensis]